MKILFASYSYQRLFFTIALADPSVFPEIVSFNLFTDLYDEIQVNLVPTETFLANENIPVWTPEPDDPNELRRLENVMQELTPLTMYRDPATCATALYFHKKKQFEGTIGHHHFIRKLSYDPVTKTIETLLNRVVASPLEKHGNRLIEFTEAIVLEAGPVMSSGIKSLGKYPETVYIETLVMVHYDITNQLQSDFTAVATYVLSLFNSVDMLFSTIQNPVIRINIAGIIIGTSLQSFPHFIQESCYQLDTNHPGMFEIDTICSYFGIKYTLADFRILSDHSYDIVIFLTGSTITGLAPESIRTDDLQKIPVFGRAFFPTNTDGYRQSLKGKAVAIISDSKYMKFFPTVAHEIAHTLSIPHDEGPLWDRDGNCNAHLMKKDDSFCKECLKFGGRTPELLKEFFSTRDGCIFHNKPRSLENPSNEELYWTMKEQCQCYGYPKVFRPKYCLPIHFMFTSAIDCQSDLKCQDENGEAHETVVYMNGTPCDKMKHGDKVCWDSKCVTVQNTNVCLNNLESYLRKF